VSLRDEMRSEAEAGLVRMVAEIDKAREEARALRVALAIACATLDKVATAVEIEARIAPLRLSAGTELAKDALALFDETMTTRVAK
jgi:hypothetical protein